MRTAIAAAALLLTAAAAPPPSPPPSLKLWRLDCGTFPQKALVNSCYLIRHGSRYMLWDTGFAADGVRPGAVLARRVVDQLALLGVPSAAVEVVGLSHMHWDHLGQAADFPQARLLIGAADWRALRALPVAAGLEPHRLSPWITNGGPVELAAGDLDVFGDGSVVMVATPGHTPGHRSLLVRLGSGPVLLSGDLYHSAGQFAGDQVPRGAADAEATRRSFRRFRRLADELNAKIIIQHEPGDVAKLPPFPEGAE